METRSALYIEETDHPVDQQYALAPGCVRLNGIVDEKIRLVCEGILKKIDMYALADYFRNTLDPFATGEFWGKIMRASCMLCAYTNDPELRQIVEAAAEDMMHIQRPDGCISTSPDHLQPKGSSGSDLWERKYVWMGLLSYYELTGDARAMDACVRLVRYTNAQVGEPPRTPVTETGWAFCGIEASSMLEPVMRIYHVTKEPAALELAEHIVKYGCCSRENIFEAIRSGTSPYQIGDNGNPKESIAKAYEMMSCMEGLCEYYRAKRNPQDLETVVAFWERVKEEEITLLGSGGADAPYNYGPGTGEQWNRTRYEQTNPDIDLMMETCVTVYWMRLCHQLLRLTGDVRYADAMEVSLYNAILGALRPDGGFFEYFPRFNGTRNTLENYVFDIKGFRLSCCTANGPTGLAMAVLAAVTRTKNGAAVNFYLPGHFCISTEQGTAELDIQSEFPRKGDVRIRVSACTLPQENQFAITVRVPGYAEHFSVHTAADLSDKKEDQKNGTAGRYLKITDSIKEGDEFRIVMDYPVIRHEALHGSNRAGDDFAAFTYGPILLARDSRDGIEPQTPISSCPVQAWTVNASKHQGFLEAHVKTEAEELVLTDYMSAGSDWENSSFASWIPVKK